MTKKHSKLGASASDRWMNCPGSIRASEGVPNAESAYALEGTVAHERIDFADEANIFSDLD